MKHLARLFSALLLATVVWGNLFAQTDSPSISFGKKITIFSAALNEKREVWIYTPNYYKGSADTYPVLYLLDGETHFMHVGAMVENLSDNLKIPQMIVVAIPNTDRIRDLTPLHSLEGLDGKVDEKLFSTTGGGDNFLKFIEQELIPYVDNNYRTQPYRILEGHSLAGMFTFYALQKSPDLFQSYIVISPAFYGANYATLKNVPDFLKSHPSLRNRLYLAIGEEPRLIKRYDSLILKLKSFSPTSLKWTSKKYDHDDHGSVVHPAMYDGLRFIYPDWWINMSDPGHALTYTELENHYRKLSKEYGYDIPTPELVIANLGFMSLEYKKIDEAIVIFLESVKKYPGSANAHFFVGLAYKDKGDIPAALKYLERSVVLKPDDEYVKGLIKELKEASSKARNGK